VRKHPYKLAALVAIVSAAALSAWLPARASAVLAPCPTPTPAASSLSDTTLEVNRLRLDQAKTCQAVTERLDAIDTTNTGNGTKLGTIRDRLAGTINVHTDRGQTSGDALYVTGPAGSQFSGAGPTGSSGDPQHVELVPASADPINEGFDALVVAVAIVLGVLLVALLAPLARRWWLP
jgi:hypothetical protein